MDTTQHTQVVAGDLLVVKAHHLGEPERTAEILEVLGESSHRHYRVRWEDGRESILYPSSDVTLRHLARAA
jgi:hypothetical protein